MTGGGGGGVLEGNNFAFVMQHWQPSPPHPFVGFFMRMPPEQDFPSVFSKHVPSPTPRDSTVMLHVLLQRDGVTGGNDGGSPPGTLGEEGCPAFPPPAPPPPEEEPYARSLLNPCTCLRIYTIINVCHI